MNQHTAADRDLSANTACPPVYGVEGAHETRWMKSLDGVWRFALEPEQSGEARGFHEETFDDAAWDTVTLPRGFETMGAECTRYRGACWYRRQFEAPSTLRGRHIVIRFECVNYNAAVWLNGRKIGTSDRGFLPFELAVSDRLRYDRPNTLVVRADNVRTRAQFPLFEGWWGEGGILREITLLATHAVHIERVRITAEPMGDAGKLRIQLDLANPVENSPVSVEVTIYDAAGAAVARLSGFEESPDGPDGALRMVREDTIDEIRPWSPESPVLYTARTDVRLGDRLVDRVTTRFGFRGIAIEKGQLRLNGRPVFLMGFNRHEDSPRTGMATDLEQARVDLLDIKNLGGNFVRFCHYPHHPGELDLCDELGLLVMAENAMNGLAVTDETGGFAWDPDDLQAVAANARVQLKQMVERDMNHPSIIVWSIGNEADENKPEIPPFHAELLQYAKSLDATRLWTHVSNSYTSAPLETLFTHDDLICINGYPTLLKHTPTPETLARGLPESTRQFEEWLTMIHTAFPGKLVLVTEFGYPLLPCEDGLEGESVQAVATHAEFQGIVGAAHACGACLWHYAHHTWPEGFTPMPIPGTSPYGYLSRDRIQRFKALDTVARMFNAQAAASLDRVTRH